MLTQRAAVGWIVLIVGMDMAVVAAGAMDSDAATMYTEGPNLIINAPNAATGDVLVNQMSLKRLFAMASKPPSTPTRPWQHGCAFSLRVNNFWLAHENCAMLPFDLQRGKNKQSQRQRWRCGLTRWRQKTSC